MYVCSLQCQAARSFTPRGDQQSQAGSWKGTRSHHYLSWWSHNSARSECCIFCRKNQRFVRHVWHPPGRQSRNHHVHRSTAKKSIVGVCDSTCLRMQRRHQSCGPWSRCQKCARPPSCGTHCTPWGGTIDIQGLLCKSCCNRWRCPWSCPKFSTKTVSRRAMPAPPSCKKLGSL